MAATPGQPPHILSGVGRDLWDLLDAPRTTKQLIASLGASVGGLLEELRVAGLVTEHLERPNDGPEVDPGERDTPAARVEITAQPTRADDPLTGAMTFWLPGAPTRITDVPLSDDGWQDLLARARRERCLGPLTWAVGTGALPTTDAQHEEAERHAILLAQHAVKQEQELLELVGWMDRAGIEVRLLKGLAVAHLDHLDPSFRASADHDLLVRSSQIAGAVTVLERHGYARELPERRRGFDRRFAKDVTMQQRDRVEVDLHRLPLAGPLGLALDADALWSHSAQVRIGGRDLQALDATGRFCHAAWSLALTDPAPRLVPALDLVAIHQSHGVDPTRLDELATPRAGRAAVDVALDLAVRLLGDVVAPLLPDLAPLVSSGRERRAIATYPGQGGSKARYLLAGTLALPRRDRAAYLAALVTPSGQYRRARRTNHRAPEWRLALRSTTRRIRRPPP